MASDNLITQPCPVILYRAALSSLNYKQDIVKRYYKGIEIDCNANFDNRKKLFENAELEIGKLGCMK